MFNHLTPLFLKEEAEEEAFYAQSHDAKNLQFKHNIF